MVTDIKMPEAIIIALDFDEYWWPDLLELVW